MLRYAARWQRALRSVVWLPFALVLWAFVHAGVHVVVGWFNGGRLGGVTWVQLGTAHPVLAPWFEVSPSGVRWVLVAPAVLSMAWASAFALVARRASTGWWVVLWVAPLVNVGCQVKALLTGDPTGDFTGVLQVWPTVVIACAFFAAHWRVRSDLFLAVVGAGLPVSSLALATPVAVFSRPRRWQLSAFVRAHGRWVIALPFVLLFGVGMHELAHVAAGTALGGSVEMIQLLPSLDDDGFRFGAVQFDEAHEFPPFLMSIAPAIWSVVIASFAGVVVPRVTRWLRPAVFMVMFAAPVIDLTLAFSGLLFERPGADLYKALEWNRSFALGAIGAFIVLLLAIERPIFNAAFGKPRLGGFELSVMTVAVMLVASLRWALPMLASPP